MVCAVALKLGRCSGLGVEDKPADAAGGVVPGVAGVELSIALWLQRCKALLAKRLTTAGDDTEGAKFVSAVIDACNADNVDLSDTLDNVVHQVYSARHPLSESKGDGGDDGDGGHDSRADGRHNLWQVFAAVDSNTVSVELRRGIASLASLTVVMAQSLVRSDRVFRLWESPSPTPTPTLRTCLLLTV